MGLNSEVFALVFLLFVVFFFLLFGLNSGDGLSEVFVLLFRGHLEEGDKGRVILNVAVKGFAREDRARRFRLAQDHLLDDVGVLEQLGNPGGGGQS